jgi:molybdopterin-containing oxidoreductase family iron-sulfur binding subunit
MAMAGFACARRPVNKIIPYVVKPEEIVPGQALYYASSDPTTGYGLLVKTREGRPIKLEGNPDHPVNQGSLTARGQAALLDLYEVERLKGHYAGDRKGGRNAISANEADGRVIRQLKEVAASGKKVRILTAPVLSDSTRELIAEFVKANSSAQHDELDVLALEDVMSGQEAAYGAAVLPHYRFDQAQVIVSLGADFLGTWPMSLEASRKFMANRKLNEKNASQAQMSQLYAFETTMTVTGANADHRYGVRPGDEFRIAAALAYELFVNRRLGRLGQDNAVASALLGYKPESIAQEVGFDVRVIRELAIELWENRGRSLVLAGGLNVRTSTSNALQALVNLLNSGLENEGKTVDGTAWVSPRRASTSARLVQLVEEMKSGQVGAMIVAGVNPCYTLAGLGFEEALKAVPFLVTSATAENETTHCADIVYGDQHFLESWGDAQVRKGIVSLQQPVIAPIHENTRSFQDTLLALMGRKETFHDVVKNHWKESVYRESGSNAPFEFFWESALRDGVVNLWKLV